MRTVGMIPARLQSSRLPEKALADIVGLPMIVHTCKRAQMATTLDEVYLATDSERIRTVAGQHEIPVIMTGTHHQTGSDRIAEAVQKVSSDLIVNIQGDEPLVMPAHIDAVVNGLIKDPMAPVAIGVTEYSKKNSPADIKAVLDLNDYVLYCSRTDLPSDARSNIKSMLKMCFIVAFRTPFLLQYSEWKPTPLEELEHNEYLRILEHGEKIKAVHIQDAHISVDTPEDLDTVRELMQSDKLRHEYSS